MARAGSVPDRMRTYLYGAIQQGLRAGLSPALFGYRVVVRETLGSYCQRRGVEKKDVLRFEEIHPEHTALNPLPENIPSKERLPADRGWWGFSFQDVPARRCAATQIATLRDCLIVPTREPSSGEFWPTIFTADRTSLAIRELHYRSWHGAALRKAGKPERIEEATWVLERVYDNHSHWLTAHLPKFVLLQNREPFRHILLPPDLPQSLAESLQHLRIDRSAFPTFESGRPLAVDRLHILSTDRYRPELLQPVQAAFAPERPRAAHRKVFISRVGATRRRLLNEDQLWPLLADHGFERVRMEALSFAEQVRLMQESRVVMGPHGAGLTNIVFCGPEANLVEIANLSFPNPNFYALASGLNLRYWLLAAEPRGDATPLERDMWLSPAALEEVLQQLPS